MVFLLLLCRYTTPRCLCHLAVSQLSPGACATSHQPSNLTVSQLPHGISQYINYLSVSQPSRGISQYISYLTVSQLPHGISQYINYPTVSQISYLTVSQLPHSISTTSQYLNYLTIDQLLHGISQYINHLIVYQLPHNISTTSQYISYLTVSQLLSRIVPSKLCYVAASVHQDLCFLCFLAACQISDCVFATSQYLRSLAVSLMPLNISVILQHLLLHRRIPAI